MPSKKAFKELGSWLTFSQKTLSLPFTWNQAKLKVELLPSKNIKQYYAFYSIFIFLNLHILHLLPQAYVIFSNSKCLLDATGTKQSCHREYMAISWIVIYTVAYFWSVAIIYNLHINRSLLVGLLNAIFHVGQQIKSGLLTSYLKNRLIHIL